MDQVGDQFSNSSYVTNSYKKEKWWEYMNLSMIVISLSQHVFFSEIEPAFTTYWTFWSVKNETKERKKKTVMHFSAQNLIVRKINALSR